MKTSSELQIREPDAPRELQPLTLHDLRDQVNLIQQVMREVMKEGEHYGAIPGTDKSKKVLLKSGAEKLCLTFKLAPRYDVKETTLPDGHLDCNVVCNLFHAPSDRFLGSGMGSCSTMESKYRWRDSQRVCPNCGAAAIIKGKAEYGGGWLCFAKKGGCGAKYTDNDDKIAGQKIGRIENPDIADTYNTVRKMAKKRALIDATLTVTAASDIFTQDLEIEERSEPKPVNSSPPAQTQQDVMVNEDQRRELVGLAERAWGKTYGDAFKRYLRTNYNITDEKQPSKYLTIEQFREIKDWLTELISSNESAPKT